jgi:dTDP-4-amino-4,6-dideoxygalactose transaminase
MYLPFVDLAITEQKGYLEKVQKAFLSIIKSGQYVMGKNLSDFENGIAERVGRRYCIGVNSGTDALFLVLLALDIGAGSEVIIPGNTFVSVANAVVNAGGLPVFCDVRYEDMLIDPDRISTLITSKTKAIIPVHLTGMPCDMERINEIADLHGLFVIEDAAQAIGAEYKSKQAGSMGVAGCFSFHPLKNIRALGDGGAIVTDDYKLYLTLKELRNHGISGGEVVRPGYNSRMDEIHAAVVSIQLEHLDDIIESKRITASRYTSALREIVNVNEEPEFKKGVYQLYMIKSPVRNDLASYLERKGISTKVHYRCYVPFHSFYLKKFGRNKELPVTEQLSREVLSLPIYPGMKKYHVDAVINTIKEYFEYCPERCSIELIRRHN